MCLDEHGTAVPWLLNCADFWQILHTPRSRRQLLRALTTPYSPDRLSMPGQRARPQLADFLGVRKHFPKKERVWLYSGFCSRGFCRRGAGQGGTLTQLSRHRGDPTPPPLIPRHFDGRRSSVADITLQFRGMAGQRLIDVQHPHAAPGGVVLSTVTLSSKSPPWVTGHRERFPSPPPDVEMACPTLAARPWFD